QLLGEFGGADQEAGTYGALPVGRERLEQALAKAQRVGPVAHHREDLLAQLARAHGAAGGQRTAVFFHRSGFGIGGGFEGFPVFALELFAVALTGLDDESLFFLFFAVGFGGVDRSVRGLDERRLLVRGLLRFRDEKRFLIRCRLSGSWLVGRLWL